MKLLSRKDFREGVFARDGNKCVMCGEASKDAHHIVERRLWLDGGYNGKWVREGHVQTHAFWRQQRVVPNKLSEN